MTMHHHNDLHDLGLAHDVAVLQGLAALPILPAVPTFGRRHALSLLGGLGAAGLLTACGSGGSGASGSTLASTSASGAATPAPADAGTRAPLGSDGPPSGDGSRPPRPPGGPPPGDGSGPPPGGPPPGGPPPGGPGDGGGQPDDGTIPPETAGPYPGDGSNGPNVLAETGVVRSDMTTDLATGEKTAGVRLTLRLTVTKGAGGQPMPGATVYLWHCDAQGRYSMYSDGVTDKTWLRAVQAANDKGEIEFTTVFPGCYAGRWPHMHFEVYPSLDAAANVNGQLVTSQLAMTGEACALAYASADYADSAGNLAGLSIETDGIFADGADRETPVFSGDAASGLTATITVPIAT